MFCFSQAWAISNIVLVPGFFSSAIPAPVVGGNPWAQPYFSQDIVSYLHNSGRLWVVDNLSPVASVEENGQRVIGFLQTHKAEMGADPVILIAHSAGGLYSIFAASHSDFPITRIITMSTPFQGLRFLQTLEDHNVDVDTLVSPFCLENLLGLKQTHVEAFLKEIRFKRPLRIDVFAGYQQASVAFWDYHNLSEALVPFQALNGEASDGIVTVRSSLAATPLKAANPNLNLQIHQQPIALEHWEMILDADFSRALGVLNISSLVNAQKRAYYDILKQSGF